MNAGQIPVAVIGGGIAGLATAFNLERRAARSGLPLRVTLFESRSDVGGHLRTIRQQGFTIEEGPNGFLDSEPATLRLVSALGLDGELVRSRDAARHRFLLKNGRLSELPLSPGGFVRTDLLSFRAKLRVACELFIRARADLGRAADRPEGDETVYEFGCRRLGRDFAETFLDPMVKGVFGGDARTLSLAAAFPRMVELEREHGGLFRALFRLSRERKRKGRGAAAPGPSGTLHSFAGGIGVLPEALRRANRALGSASRALGSACRAEILTGRRVESVERRGGSWSIRAGGRAYGPFAAVIDASPAHAACRHLADREISDLLAGIPYAPMAVISLAFDRRRVGHDLKGFGMLIPTSEKRRLLGALWTTSIFDGRAPEGKVLLRVMAGGAADPDLVAYRDARLLALCADELGGLLRFCGEPEHVWIVRHERAIAQYTRGHLARLAAIDRALARMPGLFLTGSSYRGVSINHCVAEAERTAEAVWDHLESSEAGTVAVACASA